MACIIFCLVTAALPALLIRGSTAQDDNLLVNGGFENGTTGWLGIGGELTTSDAFVHGGSFAGLFVIPSPIQGTEAEVSQCLPVDPSSDLEFRGYVARGDERPGALRLRISWSDASDCLGGRLGVEQGLAVLEEVGHWYEMVVQARSPAAARSARLRIVVEEDDATVYLDDFSVSRAVTPSETPTVEPSMSPIPSATPRPPLPSPSATPHVSPTASSWQRTPVPVQDALRNGGFEEADSQQLPSFWQKYGGELARTNEVRFEGQFAAALTSRTNSAKWAYQTVMVQGGRTYVLSARALKDDSGVAAAFLRLSWYAKRDGSGEAIDSVDSTAVLADDSPEFRFLTTGAVVAPAGAASAKVRLMLAPAGQAPGTAYFDAVTFEETALPQPTPAPTATPLVVVAYHTPTPTRPATTEPASTPPAEEGAVPTLAASATTTVVVPADASGAGTPTPAVLGAVRAPATTATAVATAATRVPASVFRERKADPSAGAEASARAESQNDLPVPLLAVAAGIPVLASASAGAYYWRWRRARLR